jgi:hypothetical protein
MGGRLFVWAVLDVLVLTAGQVGYAQEAAGPPPAFQHVLEGRNMRITAGSSVAVVEVGCEGRASLQAGNKVFVACGADGVVEVDLTNPLAPRRGGRMAVDGDATGLFLRDGRVWVEVAHVDARPVRTEAPGAAAPAMSGAPASTVAEPAREVAPAVGSLPKPSLVAPPRRGGLWELSAMAGAFVNLGPLGGGGMGWASAVYRFEAPIVVRAELAPVGLGIGQMSTSTFSGFNQNSNGNSSTGVTVVAAGHLLVGFDTQFVEVAVGGGGASISNSYNYSSSGPLASGGASIVEEGRLGARDGLALNVESTTVAANARFQFGSFVASVQVPLTQSVMLIVRGGGGSVGPLFGDLGARYLVRGDGGPDTIALTGFFGGAGIDFQSCSATPVSMPSLGGSSVGSSCQSISIGGPSVGGGVEWRR